MSAGLTAPGNDQLTARRRRILTGAPVTARDQIGRPVRRSYRPGWASILAAVPAGYVAAGGAAAWLGQVERHPMVAAMRADSRATLLAIVRRIAARMDRRTGTATLTWAELQEVSGVGRSTVGRYRLLLHRWGLLSTVHSGAAAPGHAGGSSPGNTAPCYLPLVPVLVPAAVPPVDEHGTPSVDPLVTRSVPPRERPVRAGRPAGGQHEQAHRPPRYTPDRLPHPRSPKRARYVRAAELARARPLLFGPGRVRLSALAHTVRHGVAAGWSVEDFLLLIQGPGVRPVPTGADERDAVRYPARWLAHRLDGVDLSVRPTLAAAAERERRAGEHRAHQAAEREQRAAGLQGAVTLAQSTAAGQLAALRDWLAERLPTRDRVRRRTRSPPARSPPARSPPGDILGETDPDPRGRDP